MNESKQHFSHHHILIPLRLEQGEKIACRACEERIFEPFHGCLSCNFYMHNGCMNAPRSLHHLYHPSHPLALLPIPTYPSRSFLCDACGLDGNASSYSCPHCEVDIHVQCASVPPTIFLKNHPHELKLVFGSPHGGKSSVFACMVCNGFMKPNLWLYYCEACDSSAHIRCAGGKGLTRATKEEEDGNTMVNDMARLRFQMQVNETNARLFADFLRTNSNF